MTRPPQTTFKNLTGYEIDTLPASYNLTDGHAFRGWSPDEEAIINCSEQLFKNNTRQMQLQLEREYIRDFLALGKQTHNEEQLAYLMCFTASMAFEVLANFLRLNQLNMTLIEPCFDNLADIFIRHQIPMVPFPDAHLEAPVEVFAQALERVETDAICLVTPNNPTGMTLSAENLQCLVAFCQRRQKLLVLDNCFRAYIPRDMLYDQYHIILDADIDVVLIEDTGKTWPTAEIKAPFFAISRARGFFDRIYDIYTDFLLHISPVGIKLMHEFIRLSQADELAHIQHIVQTNLQTLYHQLEGTLLTPMGKPFMSVAWLRVDYPMTGFELKEILDDHGVHILSGDHFYWTDHKLGSQFVRIALTRDPDVFAQAASMLGETCRKISINVQ